MIAYYYYFPFCINSQYNVFVKSCYKTSDHICIHEVNNHTKKSSTTAIQAYKDIHF